MSVGAAAEAGSPDRIRRHVPPVPLRRRDFGSDGLRHRAGAACCGARRLPAARGGAPLRRPALPGCGAGAHDLVAATSGRDAGAGEALSLHETLLGDLPGGPGACWGQASRGRPRTCKGRRVGAAGSGTSAPSPAGDRGSEASASRQGPGGRPLARRGSSSTPWILDEYGAVAAARASKGRLAGPRPAGGPRALRLRPCAGPRRSQAQARSFTRGSRARGRHPRAPGPIRGGAGRGLAGRDLRPERNPKAARR